MDIVKIPKEKKAKMVKTPKEPKPVKEKKQKESKPVIDKREKYTKEDWFIHYFTIFVENSYDELKAKLKMINKDTNLTSQEKKAKKDAIEAMEIKKNANMINELIRDRKLYKSNYEKVKKIRENLEKKN